MKESFKTHLGPLIIVLAGFFIYFNSLHGEFLMDDHYLVRENRFLEMGGDWKGIWTQAHMAGSGQKANFYRPLQVASYVLDYSFWKLDPFGYHLTSVLLHLAVALALFALLQKLFQDRVLSFFTSLLWVVHPVHTQAVSYISGRADILCALFLLLALNTYILCIADQVRQRKRQVMAWVFYALALLSKEYALIFLGLIAVYHASFRIKIGFKKILPYLIVTATYVLLRLTVLKFSIQYEAPPSTLWQRLPGLFAAMAEYFKVLVWPFGLHMDYGVPFFRWSDPAVWAGVGIALVLGFIGLWPNTPKWIKFSILWFFVALIPVSNLFKINSYMAEHWLYMPSIGFFVLLAFGLRGQSFNSDSTVRIKGLTPAIAILIFFSVMTIQQNHYWREPHAFYARTLQYNPESIRALYNLANFYSGQGDASKAISLYEKAIKLNPSYPHSYHNLGTVFAEQGRYAEAKALFQKVLEIDPSDREAQMNLSSLQLIEKKSRQN